MKLKKIEEKELKDAGNKRAKEIAEQKYRVSKRSLNKAYYSSILLLLLKRMFVFQERLQELERKEHEIEVEERRRMEIKKNLINDAAKKQDEPVDDSKLVEAMFDFLPDSSSEAPIPSRQTSVFMVIKTYLDFES